MVFTVGIAGITGKVALLVAKYLLQRPNVNIRGYCRSPDRVPPRLLNDPRFTLIQGQVDDVAALREFAKGCDVVACCYLADNDVMVDAQKLLIDICEEQRVDRYIASDYTLEYAKLQPGQYIKKDPIIRVHDYLKTKKIKAVHVLIGMFVETFFSNLFFFWDDKEKKFRYYGTGNETFELTTYATTAEYVAAIALDTEAVGFLRFLGDTKSSLEVIAEFKSVYGVEPAVERIGSLEDLYAKANEGGEQDFILTGTYLISKGVVNLEKKFDYEKYPDIKPEKVRDFFKRRPLSELAGSLDAVGQEWWDAGEA